MILFSWAMLLAAVVVAAVAFSETPRDRGC